MDPAIMGVIFIACCFAAGVFETGKRKKDRKDESSDAHKTKNETHDDRDA